LFQTEEKGWLLAGYYSPPNLDVDPDSKGGLLRTTNGGKSWLVLDSGDTKYSSIYFLNDSIGWLTTKSVAQGSKFYRTNNGGKTWNYQNYTYDWSEIYFADESTGWGIHNDYIGKTTNSGITWNIESYMDPPGPGDGFRSILIDDYSKGWCTGSTGFILNTTDGGNSWEHFDRRLDIYYGALDDVLFINELEGWVVGNQLLHYPLNDSTILLHTTNGGETWIREEIDIDEGLNRILKFNEQLWMFSYTSLLRSTDGGNNWDIINFHPPSDLIRDVFFFDELNFFVIAGRKVFRTRDGGNTWEFQGDFAVQYLKRIIFCDDLNGWLIGRTGSIGTPNFRTTDGGNSWFEIARDFTAIDFLDSLVGYTIEGGAVFKTINGGDTWWQVSHNPSSFAYWTTNISFISEANGWAWSRSDIYNTTDSGRTWIKSNGIYRISFIFNGGLYMINENLGWAVGSNGYIFKFTSDSVTSVNFTDLILPTKHFLSQNYPNPFNPTTTIKYQVPQNSFIILKVYDILGKEVATLVDEEKPAGFYNLELDASSLASGIYFYRLQAGSFIETKKMILVK
ncbi:MAG: YCF48-related protein, partial [Ignavibacteria bacterium]